MSANLSLPFTQLVTLRGVMGANYVFFEDDQVRGLLLRHHIQVQVTRAGSGEAIKSLDSFDFAFPSGQPAATQILRKLSEAGKTPPTYHPFTSPIVLATFREYAETLRAAGVATPQDTPGFDQPSFYDLDMGGFLGLVRDKESWNGEKLKGREHGVPNHNTVLAQTTDVCDTNGAATYLGLVSYVTHGRLPTTEQGAVDFATAIKPQFDQGLPVVSPEIIFTPEGRWTAPIVVLYEHQYLAHQLSRPVLDGDRVLLYPSTAFLTQPSFIVLDPEADQLGILLKTDPDLRRRELELGYRLLDSGKEDSTGLSTFLAERHVPVPSASFDSTAMLPDVPLLTKMISVVGDCRHEPS